MKEFTQNVLGICDFDMRFTNLLLSDDVKNENTMNTIRID